MCSLSSKWAQSGPCWEFKLRESLSWFLQVGLKVWRQICATWDVTWDEWVFGPNSRIRPLGWIWWGWVILFGQIFRVWVGPRSHPKYKVDLRGGVLFSVLILGTAFMLYIVKWIAVIDISILNLLSTKNSNMSRISLICSQISLFYSMAHITCLVG